MTSMATRRASTRSCRASPMSKEEMITMVRILDKKDYDGQKHKYDQPNVHKDKIISEVIRVLKKTHGTKRQKKQLRQRWSDLKNREMDVLTEMRKKIRTCDSQHSRHVDSPPPQPGPSFGQPQQQEFADLSRRASELITQVEAVRQCMAQVRASVQAADKKLAAVAAKAKKNL